MTHHDVTRHQAQIMLAREATLAAHYGRRFEQAVGNGDVAAARPLEPRVSAVGVSLPHARHARAGVGADHDPGR